MGGGEGGRGGREGGQLAFKGEQMPLNESWDS